MIDRDRKRDIAQVKRERDRKRKKTFDERDTKQHGQTQNLLEILAQRVTETERKLQEVEASLQIPEDPPAMSMLRGREVTRPDWTAPVAGVPTTLDRQLIRRDITQAEYDRSINERQPLVGRTKEAREVERRERDQ